jgi:CIC family chloride channel protein
MHVLLQWFRSLGNKFQTLIWAQLAKRTPKENAFLALIPAIGAITGLASMGIAHLIAFIQKYLWGSGERLLEAADATPWYWRVVVPIVGGTLVGCVAWAMRRTTRGLGSSGIIQALALKGGEISLRQELPDVASGILTVASGGSLGREGPMIGFASALGSHLARRFKLSTQQVRVLVCCAAASALAAVYNAPFGGTIFVMEILIGNFALEIFGPVVIASVISTIIYRACMGNTPRFIVPHYQLVSAWELPGYLGLGIIAGVFSIVVIKVLFWTEDAFAKLPVPRHVKPAIGFAMVGAIACRYPHVFGNGVEAANLALNQELPLTLLLVLPVAKLVATALTRGSGGSGGLFTPTLMMGALVGGAFGWGMHTWFPGQTAGHGAYALVGMGAMLAGTTQAPLTAIVMIFEQTDTYQILLPLMFVCIISNFTARLFKVQSLHIESLRRRGVVLPSGPEASIMQTLRVKDLMHEDVEAVNETEPFALLVDRFLKSPYNNLYVVDAKSSFLGAISLHGLKEMLRHSDSLDSVIAYDLMDVSFGFVTPEVCLADTMEKFWRQNCERLPVVADTTTRKLLGWISKRDLIGIYNQEILQKRTLMSRFNETGTAAGRGVYVELPKDFHLQSIAVPAAFVGQTVGEVSPGSNYSIQVLQIKHHDPVTGTTSIEQPQARSRLNVGDYLVVVGTSEAIKKFQQGKPTASVENWEI